MKDSPPGVSGLTSEDTSVPLSVQLQTVIDQLKIEVADKMKDSNPGVSRQTSADTNVPLSTHQSEVAIQLQTVIDQLKVEVADKERMIQNLRKSSMESDISTPKAPTGLLGAKDPVLATISYGEYVEPEDIKVEPNTGSETTEELNLEDILETISEIPMDPLPGQDVLDQPYVKQDANGDEHQQETSDDDSADWPGLRPLRINLGGPAQPGEHCPQDPCQQGRSRQDEKVGKGREQSEYPTTRSARRRQTRSRSPKHRRDLMLRSDSLRVAKKTVKNGGTISRPRWKSREISNML